MVYEDEHREVLMGGCVVLRHLTAMQAELAACEKAYELVNRVSRSETYYEVKGILG